MGRGLSWRKRSEVIRRVAVIVIFCPSLSRVQRFSPQFTGRTGLNPIQTSESMMTTRAFASRARLHIAGYEFMHRNSAGDLVLISHHPRGCSTWLWSVVLAKGGGNTLISRAANRMGQWHDYYRLPFGFRLIVSQQDWHKRR